MKKQMLFLAVALCALLSGCKKESERALVEAVVMPPATETFAPGAPISIGGTGFTASDQIILRPAPTEAEGDLLATITEVTATGITFTFPTETPSGAYSVILRRNGVELVLGSITVVPPVLIKSFYTQSDDLTETYQYDYKNRVVDYKRSGYMDIQCTYEPNRIRAQVVYSGETYELSIPLDNEGRVLVMDLQPLQKEWGENSLTYNADGGIKQIKNEYLSMVSFDDFTWVDGNITRRISGDMDWTYEYSDIPNKTNFDGTELIGNSPIGLSLGLNIGLKSKLLISKETRLYKNEVDRIYTYKYELNAAGYPIKMTRTRVDRSPYDLVTEITYTK